MGTIDQHTAGIAQTVINNVVTQISTGMKFEETTECRSAHSRDISYLRQTDLLSIMLIDESPDFLYTTAVT